MLNQSFVGQSLTPYSVAVERGRLRFFAKATGQTDPVYFDETAAREAGYPGLPVPPTFLFCLENESPDPHELLRLVGLDLGQLLHGEQAFVYHRAACAGDVLTFEPRITDIYTRRQGSLDFVVRETRVTDAMGYHVADLRSVIVQRGPAVTGTMNASVHPENSLGVGAAIADVPDQEPAVPATAGSYVSVHSTVAIS